MDPVNNILGKKSIRRAILEILSDRKPHKFEEIKDYVGKFYQHRGGYWGGTFLTERTNEELWRLREKDKLTRRVKHGWHQLK